MPARIIDLYTLTVVGALSLGIAIGVPAQTDTVSSNLEPAHDNVIAEDELAADAVIPLQLLLAAAESGDSSAQFDLGTRYLYGVGVEQDNFIAARWFRLAAEQNNHNAQYNLGVMSLNGLGVIADVDEALRWFHTAAENADTTAQFTLGVMYANGRGVPRDLMLAHMWFTLASAGGDESAAINAVLFQEMLTTEQVEESQRLAQEWIARFNSNVTN